MKKLTALVAGGIGYVLGSRAGRQRYEQIRSAALRLRNDPRVQQATRQAADVASKAAPVVKDKVSSASDTATSKTKKSSSQDSTVIVADDIIVDPVDITTPVDTATTTPVGTPTGGYPTV